MLEGMGDSDFTKSVLPSEQGLKPTGHHTLRPGRDTTKSVLPSEQGLKPLSRTEPVGLLIYQISTSIRTRIETLIGAAILRRRQTKSVLPSEQGLKHQ